MNRWIPITLWIMVAILGGMIYWKSKQNAQQMEVGKVFVEVPWKHLPDVPRFELVDQQGETFSSERLDGRVYAVSFFFATCPTICRDLNAQVQRLQQQSRNIDMSFLTISVDPEHDTPEILKRYAADYGAEPPRWYFLTGPLHRIKELGEHALRVSIAKEIHTDNIVLVDKWGRYRDRFKWDDPYDMQRFIRVAGELAAEMQPPLNQKFSTRNALAGVIPQNWDDVPWVREFHLTERSGQPFFSRDLTGQVWIASFFFSNCTGICVPQNQYLAGLRGRLSGEVPLVSITTDPANDTVERLREYAEQLRAPRETWWFLTGNEKLIRRIGSEFFKAEIGGDHHSSQLYVVDKWGRVRGDFDWRDAAEEVRMLQLITELQSEAKPLTIVPAPKRQTPIEE